VRACTHMSECSYVYEYLHLYYVSQKKLCSGGRLQPALKIKGQLKYYFHYFLLKNSPAPPWKHYRVTPAVRREVIGGVDLDSGGRRIRTRATAVKTGGEDRGWGGRCEAVACPLPPHREAD
jgi:hypothetical protein